MQTSKGTLEEFKLKNGKTKLVHTRPYCTEVIEVRNEDVDKVKKELGVKKTRKKKTDEPA